MKDLSQMSSAAKLALLLEKVVRKVVREELQNLKETKTITPVAKTTPSSPRPKSNLSSAVDKILTKDPLLQEIFSTTTPFGKEAYSEMEEENPLALMAEGWKQGDPLLPETPPTEIVSLPAGIDPAVSNIANILNRTNFKAIVDRSKSFDRNQD